MVSFLCMNTDHKVDMTTRLLFFFVFFFFGPTDNKEIWSSMEEGDDLSPQLFISVCVNTRIAAGQRFLFLFFFFFLFLLSQFIQPQM